MLPVSRSCRTHTVRHTAALTGAPVSPGSHIMKRRRSPKEVLAQHQASAETIRQNIRIRKSRIKSGGGGAFTKVMIPRGACVGFYEGGRSNAQEQDEKTFVNSYLADGEDGGRNAYDPEGRLRLDDDKVVNVHNWGNEEWDALQSDGVEWIGKCANWTRFMNHASAKYQNLSVCSTSNRFGRSHAFYAKRDILPDEELFYSYGVGFFKSRKITPEDPSFD